MTAEEKAKNLFGKYAMYLRANLRYDEEADEDAKQCALIAVDELMELAKKYETKNCRLLMDNLKILYWQEVKQEIEKL